MSSLEMQIQFAVFIPVLNEIENIENVKSNISSIRSIFPFAPIYISDNRSTDGTWEELSLIPSVMEGVFLSRMACQRNFAHNLSNVANVPGNPYILLLGANDIVTQDGLRHLRSAMQKDSDTDLFICNWAYYDKSEEGERRIFYTGDVTKPYVANSLDEFFLLHGYSPNGIMQWVARRELLSTFPQYRNFGNPHVGVFFNAFPCRVSGIGDPPLCLVRHLEQRGWRSSADRIMQEHIWLCREMLHALDQAWLGHKLSSKTYKQWYIRLRRIPKLILRDLECGNWGVWIHPFSPLIFRIAVWMERRRSKFLHLRVSLRALFSGR